MLTSRQRRTLETLCRRIAPAASKHSDSVIFDAVSRRIADMTAHHRRRLLLALNLIGSPSLALLLLGRPRGFGELSPEMQDLLLQRCEHHRLFTLRLAFTAVKRLIVNTWYGLPQALAEIRHPGPLHERAPLLAWEGALDSAQPVVAHTPRDRVRTREPMRNIIEASQIPGDLTVTTQFCIIGSGVGGSTAACVLAEAGRDVVILESGPFRTAADFPSDETTALRELYADAGMRGTDDLSLSILQGRCVGGGSTVNWMVMLRTPDYVLEEWARDHGVVDMSPGEMRAGFERFERENGVGRVADAAHSRANRLLLDGSRALGWRVESANVNARECMRSGACGLGCPYDAKQSMLKTYLARALDSGAHLYSGVHAVRITNTAGMKVVYAISSTGARVTIRAHRVILAAGAVETPALLQRSGLGNHNVGKHLRLHPTTAVVGVYDECVYAGTGIPLTAVCDEFVRLHGDYGHWIETAPLAAGLAATVLPGFGEAHRSQMKAYAHFAPLIVLARDGSPDDPSRGRVQWERRGRARIDYRLSHADRAILIHGMESAARIHFAMGARSVFTLHRAEETLRSTNDITKIRSANRRFGDPMLFSAHVIGTCRIGASARDGACNPDGELRGSNGIYVMDGSLLPTAPGVNPHETIAGMVHLLAGKMP
jgi:choline dehydrogenase-like flavoprotein